MPSAPFEGRRRYGQAPKSPIMRFGYSRGKALNERAAIAPAAIAITVRA
jgi:hypothetical protein